MEYPLRENGWLITTDPESDRVTTLPTIQCKHCGAHWVWMKGSGRKRGFCTRCNGLTCGRPECDNCVPFEQWLENVESGRPIHYSPITIASGWDH